MSDVALVLAGLGTMIWTVKAEIVLKYICLLYNIYMYLTKMLKGGKTALVTGICGIGVPITGLGPVIGKVSYTST